MLVSAVQHHESAICIHVSPPSWASSPIRLFHLSRSSQGTELSTLILKPTQVSAFICLALDSFLMNGSWPRSSATSRPTQVWSWAFLDASPRAGDSHLSLAFQTAPSLTPHLSPSPEPSLRLSPPPPAQLVPNISVLLLFSPEVMSNSMWPHGL